MRLPISTWLFVIFGFIAVYFFMFSVVHPIADTRICLMRLDDPLFALVPLDRAWMFVTMTLYVVITLTALFAMLSQAYLGDHRPVVRWGMALTIQGMLRSATILLVPLCKATLSPGTRVIATAPTVTLCGLTFPWRPFATNDLLFSGHVGELLLLARVTRSWPLPARGFIWIFQCLQVYGLLSTRGHYTVDMIVAVPCAYFADRVGVLLLAWMARGANPMGPATTLAPS